MPETILPPHRPPLVGVGDNDESRHHFQQWQIMVTTLTLFITAYFCTLGTVSTIISLMVAKHVLVAVLVMGLGVDARTSPASK